MTTTALLCARARPLLSPPFSLVLSPPKRPFRLTTNLRFSTKVTMSSSPQIIEHVVLFKVKDDTDKNKVDAMVNGLNALVSLDSVVHLTSGALHRTRSSPFSFTHMLHSRYKSKDDLNAYSAHADHQRVVKENVLPITDDIMAVDWIADPIPEIVAPAPGSAVKVTFLKLKENVSEEARKEIRDVIKGIKESFPGITEVTCGENFSPARAKGFSIASVAVFKDLKELEAVDSQQDMVNLEKEKVRDYIESVIVLDYVVAAASSSQSSSL